jgi:hypothetical protein
MQISEVVWTETKYESVEPYVRMMAVTNARNGMELIQSTCKATVR